MLPFFSFSTYSILGVPVQAWGTLVALGFLVGTWIAARRARANGLNEKKIFDLAFWILIAAFIGARVFHVLFYEPGYYLAHPWEALDVRKPGFAMFGGLIGAASVFFFYVRRHALDWMKYADTLIWGLPWGCGIGRIGCFLIHDHPGTLSHFVLAVKYPNGDTRHDLGLYLSLIGFATGGLFLFLNRKKRAPGFWLGAYMMMEGISRFSLDFLRVIDTRYLGLTPTQYLAVPLFFVGGYLIVRNKKTPLV